MKKKTFIVQLLDSKKPSRTSFTQVEDANFYSNDTDASLVFIPHEDTFDFQSAKVVMYNRGDESLVERDMQVTTENGRKVASYELPAEIISHWGDWTAQPVFISNEEIYSGSIVPFSVIRYLMHERPATLTEIVTVTEFIQQSQALVDDMEQAEAQRVSAESSRVSAESQRLSDEATRVGAETQRKTDHANRSAELESKADKVVLENLIPVSSTVSRNGVTVNVLNSDTNETEITVDVLGLARGIFHNIGSDNLNNIMYVYAEYLTNGMGEIRIGPDGSSTIITNKGTGEYHKYSTVTKATSNLFTFYHDTLNGNSYEVGDSFNINKRMIIDLTQTFGAGNEPTKEEMDELIKVTGYIDGEYALNNKEMLGHLMKGIHEKANKKQEDWITPTLLNGYTGDVKYRKTEFNQLEIRGVINYSTELNASPQPVFSLLPGYVPQWIDGEFADRRFKFNIVHDSQHIENKTARAVLSSYNNTFYITHGGGGRKWHVNITIPIT